MNANAQNAPTTIDGTQHHRCDLIIQLSYFEHIFVARVGDWPTETRVKYFHST